MGLRSQNNPIAAYLDVFSNSGTDAASEREPETGITATGGIIGDYTEGNNVYRTHTFTSSGTFDVTDLGNISSNVDYLVVGGGGGGGGGYEAGGGGAGGYRTTMPEGPGGGGSAETAYQIAFGSYTVTVGAGGAGGGPHPSYPGAKGNSGNQSALFPTPQSYPHPSYIRSEGGGGGGTYSSGTPHEEAIGVPGGSGGAAGNCHPNGPAAGGAADRISGTSTAVATQGYKGGDRGPQAHAAYYNGAGGGGAGAAGADQNNNTLPGSFGGNGKRTSITGPGYTIGTPGPASAGGTGGGDSTAVTGGWLAGGGGGGLYGYPNMAHLPQTRGAGGGGAGGHGGSPVVDGTSAVQGTGSGGGASGNSGRNGGSGSSGVVVIRYKIATLTGTAKATGGAISFYGGKTIHVFTSSGTFVNPASIDNVEVVMVAGGGAGGNNIGGGGGAGAVLESPGTGFTFPNNTYTITIGAGAAGRISLGPATANTANDTTISYPGPHTWTAQRGGYGASYPNVASQTGGSGGGGVSDQASGQAATASPSPTPIGTLTAYGFAGGSAPGSYSGAGGGGAGGPGADIPTGGIGGAGGVGRQLPTTFRNPAAAPSNTSDPAPYQRGGGLGTPGPVAGGFYVAGGGGGCAYPADNASHRGLGGAGGGGDGGYNSNSPPKTDGQSALENTGSGGGGSGYSPSTQSTSGSGGSGIVLIAYPS